MKKIIFLLLLTSCTINFYRIDNHPKTIDPGYQSVPMPSVFTQPLGYFPPPDYITQHEVITVEGDIYDAKDNHSNFWGRISGDDFYVVMPQIKRIVKGDTTCGHWQHITLTTYPSSQDSLWFSEPCNKP